MSYMDFLISSNSFSVFLSTLTVFWIPFLAFCQLPYLHSPILMYHCVPFRKSYCLPFLFLVFLFTFMHLEKSLVAVLSEHFVLEMCLCGIVKNAWSLQALQAISRGMYWVGGAGSWLVFVCRARVQIDTQVGHGKSLLSVEGGHDHADWSIHSLNPSLCQGEPANSMPRVRL